MTLLLPGSAELLAARAGELPQKDQLCGAFWGLLALRAAPAGGGPDRDEVALAGAGRLEQDAVALAAGTALGTSPEARVLPPGEPGRDDFRVELPVAGVGEPGGTSATGVARAVAELSGGALTVVPASGDWSGARLRALLERLAALEAPLTCIANLRTGALWGTHPAPAELLAYLETGDAAAGPPAEWDVGHFVALLGLVAGRRGALVAVADSYRSLGHDGVHLQPAERVAEALGARGLLVAVERSARAAAEQAVAAAELRCEPWDNGSPDARLSPPSP